MMLHRHLKDFFYLFASLLFYPLAYLTFFPEVRRDLLGIGATLTIEGAMWIALTACSFVLLSAKSDYDLGPMGRAGVAFLMIIFCLLTPIMIGFIAIALLVTSFGGLFDMLPFLWKPALFFGFLWFYMTAE